MPTEIRAAGLASGYFVFNALAVLIAQVTPTAIEKISWRYFLIFLIMDCIFIVIVYMFYPETMNMALESVGEAFGDKVVKIEENPSQDEERQATIKCSPKHDCAKRGDGTCQRENGSYKESCIDSNTI
jgi:hypothetical protein